MKRNKDPEYALVTGASSGIGWHMARMLAERGYHIFAVSNQADRLEMLRKKLEDDYHVHVHTLVMDLARENAALEVFQYSEKEGFHVEILVNNAGVMVYGETIDVNFPEARSILQLHMTTPALICRLFGEKMAFRRSGWILNVASISAVMPYPTISLYGPTKSFLRNFTRAIRTEMKPLGVGTTCLIPGATDTPLNDSNELSYDRVKKFGLVKNPEVVARKGLEALFKNRAECIPGFFNWCIVKMVPFIPYLSVDMVYRKFYIKRKKSVKH